MLQLGMQPDQTPETAPTFGTLPGVASINSVFSYGCDCGEEDGTQHVELKGESLDGTMGWED